MHLEVDIVPVSDVDRAKHFYEDLGWRLDDDAGRLLKAALASGKPLAIVCHAPAAMLATRIQGL